MARNSRSPALFPARVFSIAFTDIMRGVPVILWIYLIGFGVPGLGLDRPWNNPLIWGSVALVLTYSSYVAEVFRAGIESVHESQRAAARSLGLSSWQTMRHVVLPQAIRRVIPPLMNDMVSLQKDVALVSLIGPVEILRQAGIDKSKFANFTPYVVAAVIFLSITIPLTRTTDWLIERERKRTTGTRVR
jgi:polar amino acid transport system permease protein